MAIELQQIDEEKIYVNEKLVRKDSSNNWVCAHELTTDERIVFDAHLRSIGEI